MKKNSLHVGLMSLFILISSWGPSITAQTTARKIENIEKLNSTTIKLSFDNQQEMLIDFYGDHIFRVFQDNSGGKMRAPVAKPEAQILVNDARRQVTRLDVSKSTNGRYLISTPKIMIHFDSEGLFSIEDRRRNKVVVSEARPVEFEKTKTIMTLTAHPDDYFYGGGVQNGRFSHKGTAINIVNENSWTDGGVASPKPYFWSTAGYGFMWYTFKKGRYDFESKEPNVVSLVHETNYLDVFFMINNDPIDLLRDYYQLTGRPVLIPKFGFYEGHLNAYNRDYWKESKKGILFEDGKRYVESQKDNGGIKESLNGEKNNYMFSARAVIDRYQKHDMPLGWILPNDGYGAGYGQTETLDGNIQNLKVFGDYARKHGVEVGLWTQSDLHPKPDVEALLQRDIIKEVKNAGVRILKTDVAWVGAGYSFGLNGIQEVAEIMPREGNDARPFIITLDGWAGTQHYAGIWSGDQTGGHWEYIRFHIPTYIGSGLSGQPNITSDMDGIFGGKNPFVNVRDFQWKTFTPMQLNMDGWGANPKYPFIMGEPYTSINRTYLKLKSRLLPYAYSVAKEAVDGEPMMRPLFLEEVNAYTLGKATQYEYLYGPYFLIAPIYQETQMDKDGNDIRNHIYLPQGKWIDFFSGKVYDGGHVINNFDAPIWKLPTFVKAGAIIPTTVSNNHVGEIPKNHRQYMIYPYGESSFVEYNDDGVTTAYIRGEATQTEIRSSLIPSGDVLTLTVDPTKGHYKGFVNKQSTEFIVNISRLPKQVVATVGSQTLPLVRVTSREEYERRSNVYYYNQRPDLNRYATEGSDFAKVEIIKNPELMIKLAPTDVTKNGIRVVVSGYRFDYSNSLLRKVGSLTTPSGFTVDDAHRTPYSLTPTWQPVENTDYYELNVDGLIFSTIREDSLLIENLKPETTHELMLRAVNRSGASPWVKLTSITKSDPLQFAIKGISGQISVPVQGGFEIKNLFDRSEGTIMHTKYQTKAVPFDVVIDLKSFNTLDKLEYVPRGDAGNGTFLSGSIAYSNDKKNWTPAGDFKWERSSQSKVFEFSSHPYARYVKVSVNEGVGDYGSGKEIYVFKVPGTESVIPGDINNDGKIDSNDFTSYMNYTGLRRGDSDFDGYVSRGDVNNNGWIDAYDISNVAIMLDGGVANPSAPEVNGQLEMSVPKREYRAGEIISITVSGKDLVSVNALSMVIPYNSNDYEYIGVKPINMLSMTDMTKDRIHANGDRVLYPTFVNVGRGQYLSGSKNLFTIDLKAKRSLTFDLHSSATLLVDVNLNQQSN